MQNKVVAQRYAKALIDLAVQRNELEKTKEDIDFIRASMSPELRMVMASPVIGDKKKTEIFRTIFQDKLSPLTYSFFNLVFSILETIRL